jgi:hypothetical protein
MKNQIVIVLLLTVAAVLSVVLTGCAAPGLTRAEVHQRHHEAIQTDLWQLQDDIDAFFLFDRPGRMHRLPVR